VTGNRNANKKEEINEGEMQLASVTRNKSPTKINLHWDSWPIYLTTTTVVVLRKRNSLALMSIDKKCSGLCQS